MAEYHPQREGLLMFIDVYWAYHMTSQLNPLKSHYINPYIYMYIHIYKSH